MLYKVTKSVIFPKHYTEFSWTFKTKNTVTALGLDIIRQQILNFAHLNRRSRHPGLFFLSLVRVSEIANPVQTESAGECLRNIKCKFTMMLLFYVLMPLLSSWNNIVKCRWNENFKSFLHIVYAILSFLHIVCANSFVQVEWNCVSRLSFSCFLAKLPPSCKWATYLWWCSTEQRIAEPTFFRFTAD